MTYRQWIIPSWIGGFGQAVLMTVPANSIDKMRKTRKFCAP
jgi:hypothetical protein